MESFLIVINYYTSCPCSSLSLIRVITSKYLCLNFRSNPSGKKIPGLWAEVICLIIHSILVGVRIKILAGFPKSILTTLPELLGHKHLIPALSISSLLKIKNVFTFIYKPSLEVVVLLRSFIDSRLVRQKSTCITTLSKDRKSVV